MVAAPSVVHDDLPHDVAALFRRIEKSLKLHSLSFGLVVMDDNGRPYSLSRANRTGLVVAGLEHAQRRRSGEGGPLHVRQLRRLDRPRPAGHPRRRGVPGRGRELNRIRRAAAVRRDADHPTAFIHQETIMTDTQTLDRPTDAVEVKPGLGRTLVVADRGHVWAAEDVTFDDDFARLKGARAVRRWGTSEGLNELANKGPMPSTRLDAPADLLVSRRALIAVIPCEAEKWTA